MLEGQEDVTVADWLAYAEAAERLGYDGFFTSDHYFSVVGAEGRGSLDVWGVLCALAAVTKRIQLGTMVSPVTFRPPVVWRSWRWWPTASRAGASRSASAPAGTIPSTEVRPAVPAVRRAAADAGRAGRRSSGGSPTARRSTSAARTTRWRARRCCRDPQRAAADPLRRVGQAEGRRAGREVGRRLQPLPRHPRDRPRGPRAAGRGLRGDRPRSGDAAAERDGKPRGRHRRGRLPPPAGRRRTPGRWRTGDAEDRGRRQRHPGPRHRAHRGAARGGRGPVLPEPPRPPRSGDGRARGDRGPPHAR